jgi:ribosomal protein S18 acetylase RimI-like enzyme
MSSPGADVSVRVAWADDAEAIAAVQLRTWPSTYGDVVPADQLPSGPEAEAQVAGAWRQSLASPGDARNRVLVALERNTVRGFAVTGPAQDPDRDPIADGEIAELTVDPDHTHQGHGSRLVQASAETLKADKFTHAVIWLASTDDDRRAFLTGAGWDADGAHRELDLHGDGSVRVKQIRLHTAIA